MPCRCDYPGPTQRQREAVRAWHMMSYVYDMLDEVKPEIWYKIEPHIWSWEHNDYWGEHTWASIEDEDTHEIVRSLCKTVTEMDDALRYDITYGNPRDKRARKLCDWWEDHQEMDRLRKEREEQERKDEEIRQDALNSLTDEQKRVLGL